MWLVVVVLFVVLLSSHPISAFSWTCRARAGFTHRHLATSRQQPRGVKLSASSEHVSVSRRIESTERPYIEDVLEKYSGIDGLTSLALGSSHWTPPPSALAALQSDGLQAPSTHKYSSILGLPALQERIRSHLQRVSHRGIATADEQVVVTAGANQAMVNVALALCDANDSAVVVAPYYFSHLMALQLAGAKVHSSGFDPRTLRPDFDKLQRTFEDVRPKVLVVTNPSNPSGLVWSREDLQRLVALCKAHDVWLVVDQTYYEFLYEDAEHIFVSRSDFDFDKVVNIFSMSKVFGMPGWRVGYLVLPQSLVPSMRKIQDTIPTHAAVLSQQLAVHCFDTYTPTMEEHEANNPWFHQHLQSLEKVREKLWPVLEPLGTVKTKGAFYFLVPLPPQIEEAEAVDILAKSYGVLLMHGSPFGAPGHLRLSYGSIAPQQVIDAVDKIRNGFERLQQMSNERCAAKA